MSSAERKDFSVPHQIAQIIYVMRLFYQIESHSMHISYIFLYIQEKWQSLPQPMTLVNVFTLEIDHKHFIKLKMFYHEFEISNFELAFSW